MLKLDTNSGFHELFLIYKQDDIIQMLDFLIDNIFALFWWTDISTNGYGRSGRKFSVNLRYQQQWLEQLRRWNTRNTDLGTTSIGILN
jgi:hypothetical protein